MRIGIVGAPINNGNLGCMALSYSLVTVLKEIEEKNKYEFEYVFFDWKYDKNKIDYFCRKAKIDNKKVYFCNFIYLSNPLRLIKNISKLIEIKKEIKKCDLFIDLTEGDSFSDIYGDLTFNGRTNFKLLVEKNKKPLVLGPQTYGPFLKEKNLAKAYKAISKASLCFTRDIQSQETIEKYTEKKAIFTTDLAFNLPYHSQRKIKKDKIIIGINVSNLLANDDGEVNKKRFVLKTDYNYYIRKIIETLIYNKNYEIHLISHVEEDYKINTILNKEFSETTLVKRFNDPMEAKEYISKMDVFIGARMHATIAAFTSGIACIPTAYSPKFKKLFSSFGYNVLIDLNNMETNEAITKTIEYIKDYKKIEKMLEETKNDWKQKSELFQKKLEKLIKEIGR